MCTHMCMATKTITIMEDAYELLLRQKEEGESFSEVLRRVLHKQDKRAQLESVFGAWSDETAKDVKKSIEEGRKRSRERAKRRDAEFIASTRRS